MNNRLSIVYAYPCRWEDTPSRQRYLMSAISQHLPVVFLNHPYIQGKLIEVKKPSAERIHDNLTIIHNALGFRHSRIGKRFGPAGAALDASWLHTLLHSIGVTDYIYWLSAPMPRLLWGMRAEHLVYDCIDPCFSPEHSQEHDKNEQIVVKKAKIVFCTAQILLERMQSINNHCYLLPNACSFDAHGGPRSIKMPLPVSLRDHKQPIIGYMGTIDGRVDVEILIEAARSLPEFTFVLVGRVNSDQEERVKALRALPNVIMPGVASVEEGQAYNAAFDVGLIPFIPGLINDAVNPVKMYMYLAAGKPVVTTNLREPSRHVSLVAVTRDSAEFVDAIRSAVVDDSPLKVALRKSFAQENRWEDRATTAIECLRRVGVLPEGLISPRESSYVA